MRETSEAADLTALVKREFAAAAAAAPHDLVYPSHMDAEDFAGRLGDGPAWLISEQDMNYLRVSLEAMTPEGFRYGVAPFIVFSILNPNTAVADGLVVTLSCMQRDVGKLRFLRSALSSGEEEAIIKALRYIVKARDADRATTTAYESVHSQALAAWS